MFEIKKLEIDEIPKVIDLNGAEKTGTDTYYGNLMKHMQNNWNEVLMIPIQYGHILYCPEGRQSNCRSTLP